MVVEATEPAVLSSSQHYGVGVDYAADEQHAHTTNPLKNIHGCATLRRTLDSVLAKDMSTPTAFWSKFLADAERGASTTGY